MNEYESSDDGQNYYSSDEEQDIVPIILSVSKIPSEEDITLHKKSKSEEEKCKYRTPCIRDFQEALVDNTKEDPLFYTTLSGITAAVGLATNSPATIIGSMLLSPIGDIIVKLSLILNFNAQKYNGKTTIDYSRQAFQYRFLDKLGIPSKYIYINNDKNDRLNIQLKSIDPEVKGNIDEIYRYRGKVYFSYTSDLLLYDVYGDPKFVVIRDQDENESYRNSELERLKREKEQYVPNDKGFEKIYRIPIAIQEIGQFETKIDDIIANEPDISKKFKSLSIEYVEYKLELYEKQDIIPWTDDTYLGKKYKFLDVFGWGIVICIWAIIIGIICSVCFGIFQYEQQKKKQEQIESIQRKIDNEKNNSKKLELIGELQTLQNNRIPWFTIPTSEMTDRTKIENAIGMIFIAICAGIILPEAVRHNSSTKMVGIGIATALLPPLINIGMYIGLLILINTNEEYKKHLSMSNQDIKNAVITGFIIFIINFGIMLALSTIRLYNFCDAEQTSIFKSFGLC